MSRSHWIGLTGGLSLVTLLVASLSVINPLPAAQRKPVKSPDSAGEVPKAWGDLAGVTGSADRVVLVFKSLEDGTLRVVSVGNELSGRVITLERR